MKLNWGWGLAIFLSIFLIAILSFVFFTTTQQVNLVEKDYYPKGITYEQQIVKKRNAQSLSSKIGIKQIEGTITVQFPEASFSSTTKGTLHFSHIENYKLDQQFNLALDSNGQQKIATKSFVQGRYILKVDWNNNENSYYQEINTRIK